jgi:hypothetical protein
VVGPLTTEGKRSPTNLSPAYRLPIDVMRSPCPNDPHSRSARRTDLRAPKTTRQANMPAMTTDATKRAVLRLEFDPLTAFDDGGGCIDGRANSG